MTADITDSSSEPNAGLRHRWLQLWQSLELDPMRIPDLRPLLQAYESPGRHYHNLRHIRHCLTELDGSRALAEDPVAIELAIWFHDVVYDATRHDNEELSAELASGIMQNAAVSKPLIEQVRGLILATKHQQVPDERDAQLLVDIDLSILGQSTAVFDEYERAIRREYQHVPPDAFRAGRLAVLNSFLARQNLPDGHVSQSLRKYSPRKSSAFD